LVTEASAILVAVGGVQDVQRSDLETPEGTVQGIYLHGTHLSCCTNFSGQEISLDDFAAVEDSASASIDTPASPVDSELEQDDIKVVFHPSTGIPNQLYRFDDYCGTESTAAHPGHTSSLPPVDGSRPWRPFRTKLDFELAEVMLDAHMNGAQTERLLSLIHQAVLDPESFTLANLKDLSHIWDMARETRTDKVFSKLHSCIILVDPAPYQPISKFEKRTISVQYKDEELNYDVYVRPLWSWCKELLLDGEIATQLVWDAQRLYRWTGERFERFIDEPWTADAWWNFQVTKYIQLQITLC
jgi:hypothetical protein